MLRESMATPLTGPLWPVHVGEDYITGEEHYSKA